jgi:hypothetical protein
MWIFSFRFCYAGSFRLRDAIQTGVTASKKEFSGAIQTALQMSQGVVMCFFGGQPAVQTLPATKTCTGTDAIRDAAFATAALRSNIIFLSPGAEVANGKTFPL